ncbi:hypothetical protein WBG78_27700 [Chryseolinea sp. T2]|uniref:hypothetical protein n=1 Tax=Chryseolinea sp. T2 TaxID=3129255 RepID=UPI003076F034
MNTLSIKKESNYFSALEHPEAFGEIKVMAHQVAEIPGDYKPEMLISFLRDHSLKTEWLDGNELLVRLITSGSMKTYQTERLFQQRRANKLFIADLETCIRGQLSTCKSNLTHKWVVSAASYAQTLQWQRYYGSDTALRHTQKLTPGVQQKWSGKAVSTAKASPIMVWIRATIQQYFPAPPDETLL